MLEIRAQMINYGDLVRAYALWAFYLQITLAILFRASMGERV